jgi:hypothetical protein
MRDRRIKQETNPIFVVSHECSFSMVKLTLLASTHPAAFGCCFNCQ